MVGQFCRSSPHRHFPAASSFTYTVLHFQPLDSGVWPAKMPDEPPRAYIAHHKTMRSTKWQMRPGDREQVEVEPIKRCVGRPREDKRSRQHSLHKLAIRAKSAMPDG